MGIDFPPFKRGCHKTAVTQFEDMSAVLSRCIICKQIADV